MKINIYAPFEELDSLIGNGRSDVQVDLFAQNWPDKAGVISRLSDGSIVMYDNSTKYGYPIRKIAKQPKARIPLTSNTQQCVCGDEIGWAVDDQWFNFKIIQSAHCLNGDKHVPSAINKPTQEEIEEIKKFQAYEGKLNA